LAGDSETAQRFGLCSEETISAKGGIQRDSGK
jgi:hypothetical protein